MVKCLFVVVFVTVNVFVTAVVIVVFVVVTIVGNTFVAGSSKKKVGSSTKLLVPTLAFCGAVSACINCTKQIVLLDFLISWIILLCVVSL